MWQNFTVPIFSIFLVYLRHVFIPVFSTYLTHLHYIFIPDFSTFLPHLHHIFTFSIQSCRSCYARLYLCQRPFYKILVKVRNSKKNVLKIDLIIVNINKDENKSLIFKSILS